MVPDAWDEVEQWYRAVMFGPLKVSDLDRRMQEPVSKMIFERALSPKSERTLVIHVIFHRPSSTLKVFTPGGLQLECEANGSAWGDGGANAPYGHDCQVAPGHYLLTQVESINPPIPSEGAYQIYVSDLDAHTRQKLLDAGKAEPHDGGLSIGGIVGELGNLAKYDRSEVMCHGGGSNLGDPACFEPNQPLCRTYGCTRLHNGDLEKLAGLVKVALMSGQTVVYSIIGDSPELSQ